MTNEEKANAICAKYGVSKLIPTQEECIAYNVALEMAEWKDKEFNEEIKELLELVKMLPVNENNQSIIEDLNGMLK